MVRNSKITHSRFVDISTKSGADIDKSAAFELISLWRWLIISVVFAAFAWVLTAKFILPTDWEKVPYWFFDAAWQAFVYKNHEAGYKMTAVIEWVNGNFWYKYALVAYMAFGISSAVLLKLFFIFLGRK